MLLDDLTKRNISVFADLKLFDVPATVSRATATLADSGAKFLTVHGNDAMMAAAAKAKGDLKILAVTALTGLLMPGILPIWVFIVMCAIWFHRARGGRWNAVAMAWYLRVWKLRLCAANAAIN